MLFNLFSLAFKGLGFCIYHQFKKKKKKNIKEPEMKLHSIFQKRLFSTIVDAI